MNKSPHASLTKTCSRCGLQKPLAAFLQLSGSVGSIYGNVCSTCRKTSKEKDKPSTDEGSSTSRLAYKIDAKAKAQSDLEKRLAREHNQELDQKDRENKEIAKETRKEKIRTIAKKEQQHRKEMKKGLFSEAKAKEKAIATANVATREKQFFAGENAKKTVDYTKPVLDTQIAGKVKHHSSVFNSLQTWLGKKNNAFLNNVQKMGLHKKTQAGSGGGAKPSEKVEKPSNTPSSTRKR